MLLLLGGILLAGASLALPQLQLSTMLVVILTVAFIALSIAAPQHFAYVFFGAFAVHHGMVHMLEMSATVTAMGYMLGLLSSSGLLLGLILRQVVATRKAHSNTTS